MKKIILLIFGIAGYFSSSAQFSLYVMPSFDLPINIEGGHKYNSTIGYRLGMRKVVRKKNSIGLSFGYTSFSPKKKIIEHKDEEFIYGYRDSFREYVDNAIDTNCNCGYNEELESVKMIPILFELDVNLGKNKKIKPFIGVNAGIRLVLINHLYHIYDSTGFSHAVTTENKISPYINGAAKIGMRYIIDEHFSIFHESSAHVYTSISHINEQVYNGYVPNLIMNFSFGFGIIYTFNKKPDTKVYYN